MFAKRLVLSLIFATLACLAFASFTTVSEAGGDKKKGKKKVVKKKEVWTDAADPTLPADFKYQGEYLIQERDGASIGAQVIALGNGYFQAVMLKRGLPGMGWNGSAKALLDGKLDGDKVTFTPAAGKRKYLAQSPLEFAATTKFTPIPAGQMSAVISGDVMTLDVVEGDKKELAALKKITRKSPTLGQKPPEGALVLFDGTNKSEWNGGRLDKKTGFLNTDGSDMTTKRKFSNYLVHVEFLLPFRPAARGQGRGNSGFYQVDHYEVQILDSFGLDGKNNECGGVYSRLDPKLNMCLPPLQWQTYDVEFTNAVRDGDKLIKKSRLTVRLNGVVVHDNVEIPGVTGGARMEPEGTPGLLRLQGHGNPLQFRNIWIVEKK
ncbi:MAG: DUF1080 domain-containing protein [Planctomycetes bacterium]|nr:DUF1080 domain-containing protein [Planctomycetota bacterium]